MGKKIKSRFNLKLFEFKSNFHSEPSSKAIFKEHIGNPNMKDQEKGSFRSLDLSHTIERQTRDGVDVMV